MKKLLIATNILLLGIVIFEACHITSNVAADNGNQNDRVLFTNNSKGQRAIDVPPGEPPVFSPLPPQEGMLEYNEAKAMSERYRDDPNKGRISDFLMTPDATCIWFSLETLEEYIANIKASVAGKPCPLNLGIRMYYIMYPNSVDDFASTRMLEPGVRNHHAVMLVPTYYNKTKKLDIDFNINNVGTWDCHPYPFYMSEGASTGSPILAFVGRGYYANRRDPSDPPPYALNHGGINPPPYDADGTFPIPDGPEAMWGEGYSFPVLPAREQHRKADSIKHR